MLKEILPKKQKKLFFVQLEVFLITSVLQSSYNSEFRSVSNCSIELIISKKVITNCFFFIQTKNGDTETTATITITYHCNNKH